MTGPGVRARLGRGIRDAHRDEGGISYVTVIGALFTLIAVAGLIVLIARFKVNAIVAIVLAALFIGLASGMELSTIMKRFQEGIGGVLGSIAMILGLGNMLGKMMAESGGAERIAVTLVQHFGESRVHWTIRSASSGSAPPTVPCSRRSSPA